MIDFHKVIIVLLASIVGVFGFSPSTQQITPESVCVANWEWNTTSPNGPFWESPWPDNTLGVIDLRNLSQAGAPGPVAQGYGLFILNSNALCSGPGVLREYGPNLDATLRAPEVASLETATGLPNNAISSNTLRGALWEIFTEDADPTGLSGIRPLMPDRARKVSLTIPGYGEVQQARLSGTHLTNAENVFRADFVRNFLAGTPTTTLRKWTGATMFHYYGEMNNVRADQLMPSEHRLIGWERPDTVITDTFTVGADANIEDDTSDIAWALVSGDIDVLNASDTARSIGTGFQIARTETSLSDDDQYSQVDVSTDSEVSLTPVQGAMVRKDNTATDTHYYVAAQWFQDDIQLFKRIAGTPTELADTSQTDVVSGDTLRIEAVGSNLRSYYNGSLIASVSDTAITGNFYPGIAGADSFGSYAEWDNFEAGDLRRRIIIISQVQDWLTKYLSPRFS